MSMPVPVMVTLVLAGLAVIFQVAAQDNLRQDAQTAPWFRWASRDEYTSLGWSLAVVSRVLMALAIGALLVGMFS